MTDEEKQSHITCPFCGEEDFDLIGLKDHLLSSHCEVFNHTDNLTNMFVNLFKEKEDEETSR